MPLWEKDSVFEHLDRITALEKKFGLQNRLRGCTLFELEMITELVAIKIELDRIKYEAEHSS